MQKSRNCPILAWKIRYLGLRGADAPSGHIDHVVVAETFQRALNDSPVGRVKSNFLQHKHGNSPRQDPLHVWQGLKYIRASNVPSRYVAADPFPTPASGQFHIPPDGAFPEVEPSLLLLSAVCLPAIELALV